MEAEAGVGRGIGVVSVGDRTGNRMESDWRYHFLFLVSEEIVISWLPAKLPLNLG